MTLSLPFVSDRRPRRVFYLGSHHLTVYEWRHGEMVDAVFFPADDDGLMAFSQYLDRSQQVPALFLVDVVEEEYRRDTLPHVRGRDRTQLIEHRTGRLFRDTPYRHVIFQGRERVGRKDDQVLYMAVTSPELLSPWLVVVQQRRVPLAGIYSLPLLTGALLPMLAAEKGNALVVSLQSAGNLRQSFFQDRHLKMSRLAHLPADSGPGLTDAVVDEVEKLRRYLNSLRLVPREEGLDVYLLVGFDLLDTDSEALTSTPFTRYHVIDPSHLAERVGAVRPLDSPYADGLFAQLLVRDQPRNHYGSAGDVRYHALGRARLAMLAASVLLVIGSFTWSGLKIAEGLSFQERSHYARHQAAFYRARYEQAKAELPPTPLEPPALKAVVDVAERLTGKRTTPLAAMTVIGRGLASSPKLQIDRIDWQVADQPPSFEPSARSVRPVNASRDFTRDARQGVYHLVLISGQIRPFNGDYREALALVRHLEEALRQTEGVYEVRALDLPLDVGPGGNLSGDAGADSGPKQASFSLRVVVTDEPQAT